MKDLKQTKEIKITEYEKSLIQVYIVDDIVNDYGWEHPEACGWVESICGSFSEKHGNSISVRGVMSSLVKKGIMYSNGEVCSLSPIGIKVAKECQ